MIAIIDYGSGNIRAFGNVYHRLNIPFTFAKKPADLKTATKIILPGVGAFDYTIQRLEKSGMLQFLDELVSDRHVPILGICVGMQIFAHSSEEGRLPGLGWIDGEVKKFRLSSSRDVKRVPHMGWNNLRLLKTNVLFNGIDQDSRFYFLHSYYFRCLKNEDVVAFTDYDGEFACVVNSRNIFGIQFHAEKSHHWGMRLLENYGKL